MKYTAYVGSATGENRNEGIHVFECDADTGDFKTLAAYDAYADTTYMALNRDGTRLYSVLGRRAFGPGGRNGGLAVPVPNPFS